MRVLQAAAGMIVLNHSVADNQPHVVGDGNHFELQGSAVELQSVTGPAHAGNELIHNANSRPHKRILGELAELRHFRHVEALLEHAADALAPIIVKVKPLDAEPLLREQLVERR